MAVVGKFQYELTQSVTGSFFQDDTIEFTFQAMGSSGLTRNAEQKVDLYYSLNSESISWVNVANYPKTFGVGTSYATKSFSAPATANWQAIKAVITGSVFTASDDTGNGAKSPIQVDYDALQIASYTPKSELTDEGLLVFRSPSRYIKADKDGIEIKGGTFQTERLIAEELEVFGDVTIFGDYQASPIPPYEGAMSDIVSGSGNVSNGTSADYARGDHNHELTFGTVNNLLSNASSVTGVNQFTHNLDTTGNLRIGTALTSVNRITGSLHITGSLLRIDSDVLFTGADQSVDFGHNTLTQVANIKIQDTGYREGYSFPNNANAYIYVNQINTTDNFDSGTDTTGTLTLDNVSTGGRKAGILLRDDSYATLLASGSKVSIGNTNPHAKLHINYNDSETNPIANWGDPANNHRLGLLIENDNTAVGTYASIDFRAADADARILLDYNNSNDGDMHFIVDNNTSPLTAMLIQSAGNVNIGTTKSHSEKLTVASGSVRFMTNSTNGSGSEFNFEEAPARGDGSYANQEALLQLRNNSNWGLLMRSDKNHPIIGAYNGGTLNIQPYASSSGVPDHHKGVLMRYDFANMRVGVGTGSPTSSFHIVSQSGTDNSAIGTTLLTLENDITDVNGTGDLNQQKVFIDFSLTDSNANNHPQVKIGAEVGKNGNANSQFLEGAGAFVVYTSDGPDTTNGKDNTIEQFRVDHQGFVGIGIADPQYHLHINSADVNEIARFASTDDDALISVGDDNDTTYWGYDHSAGIMSLGFDNGMGSSNLSIRGDGKVGIGTTTPTEILDLSGSLALDGHKILEVSADTATRGPFNPVVGALQKSGKCLRLDTDFADGTNGVTLYNNAGDGSVTLTREDWSQTSASAWFGYSSPTGSSAPNSSGKVIKIHYGGASAGDPSPGDGGFYQTFANPSGGAVSQVGHTYVQVFQALIPAGRTLTANENPQGSSKKTYWLTGNKGTGKWEWYARVNQTGDAAHPSQGSAGHVSINETDTETIWYLASCTVYDMTEQDISTFRRIGIGTIAPNNPLSVSGSMSVFNSNGTSRLTVGEEDHAGESGNNVLVIEGDGLNNKTRIFTKNTSNHFVAEALGNNSDIKLSAKRDILFGITSGTGYNHTTKMIIKNDGKVGIGATNPQAPLHVVGNISASADIDLYGNPSTINFVTPDESNAYIKGSTSNLDLVHSQGQYEAGIRLTSQGNIQFATDHNSGLDFSNTHMIISHSTSNGTAKVGIGTTNPDVQVHISASTQAILKLEGAGESQYQGGRIYLKAPGVDAGNTMNSVWINGTLSTDGGNFDGVYTLGMQRRGIQSATDDQYGGNIYTYRDGYGHLWSAATSKTATGAANRFFVSASGPVGINTVSPGMYMLNVVATGSNSLIRAYGSSIARYSLQNSSRHYSTSVQGSDWLFFNETGGKEVMRIKPTGRLGINTTGPDALLEVEGSGWAAEGIRVTSTGSGGAVLTLADTDRRFEVASRNDGFNIRDITDSDTSRFNISSTGNVHAVSKLGVAGSPDYNVELDVRGDGLFTGKRIYFAHDGGTDSNNDFMRFSDTDWEDASGVLSLHADQARSVGTGSVGAALFTDGMYSKGTVAIGTDSPQRFFHIKSTDGVAALIESSHTTNAMMDISSSAADGGAGIRLSTANNKWTFGASGSDFIIAEGLNNIQAFPDNAKRFTITDGGTVAIGEITPDPDALLHIGTYDGGVNNDRYVFRVEGSGSNGTGMVIYQKDTVSTVAHWYAKSNNVYFGASDNEHVHFQTKLKTRMTVHEHGNIGIGTTSPKAHLHINSGSYGGDGQAFGGKDVELDEDWTAVLTIGLADHQSCYVKMTMNGNWGNHSGIMFLGEYFIANSAGGYNEPGQIIRQVENTGGVDANRDSDTIRTRLVSSGDTVEIQAEIIEGIAGHTETATAKINFHIMGEFDTIT